MESFDVVIIGAGGAGMMCAIEAGKRKLKVVLLDHSSKLGRKILISGGGRCNFTNINASPANYVSKNSHFAKSALSRYTPDDFIGLVEKHRIRYHEKKLGQLFCDSSAEQIVHMLASECSDANAPIRLNCQVRTVTKVEDGFTLITNSGTIKTKSLVIATGGLSIPQIGATGFGYDIAKQFGLKIVETAPALDGFNFSPPDLKRFAELTGVSVDCIVSCNGAAFRENILFTHNGLSGPASLQASLYWHKKMPIELNLLPERDSHAWLTEERTRHPKTEIKNLLSNALPKRFAERFCEFQKISGTLSHLSESDLVRLCDNLHGWKIFPDSTVGYKKAEVTRGGVDTDELSSKTMEAKKVSGLYFVGEVVDVTGQLGGYNFQWAWASGWAAGQVAG